MSALFVAVMLLAQIGIAQHYTVHFTDHGLYEHHYDDHAEDDTNSDHKKNASEACQICLLTKSLSLGIVPSDVYLSARVISTHTFAKTHDQRNTPAKYASYNPRAPPAFLI